MVTCGRVVSGSVKSCSRVSSDVRVGWAKTMQGRKQLRKQLVDNPISGMNRGARIGARTRELNSQHYLPSAASALRRGVLEICIKPENGRSSSRIRNNAPATEIAATNSVTIAVALRGANNP